MLEAGAVAVVGGNGRVVVLAAISSSWDFPTCDQEILVFHACNMEALEVDGGNRASGARSVNYTEEGKSWLGPTSLQVLPQ